MKSIYKQAILVENAERLRRKKKLKKIRNGALLGLSIAIPLVIATVLPVSIPLISWTRKVKFVKH